MCDTYPEQRPLLCDDVSEEEFKIQRSSPRCQRRIRNSLRLKNQLKGAAVVISHWPDHLSSLLAYWWAGLGMVAITIFIIYNCFSMIENVSSVSAIHATVMPQENFITNTSRKESELLNIYMHLYVKGQEEVFPDNYLPYIKIVAKKHRNLKFNLILVINDIPSDINRELSEKNNNEMAMNSLWSDKYKSDKKKWIENISIQYISLSTFLDESPLKKYWRRLPQDLLEFLVRCVAIWERGGIAFNPIILTPQSPSPVYMEKLQYILRKYSKHVNYKYKHKESTKKIGSRSQHNLKVNNIRDIIEALENKNNISDIQYNLTEAENRESKNIEIMRRDTHTSDFKIETKNKIISDTKNTVGKNLTNILTNETKYVSPQQSNYLKNIIYNKKNNNKTYKNMHNDNTTQNSILPMFLKYLFHEEVEKPQLLKDSTVHYLETNKSFTPSQATNDLMVKQGNGVFTTIKSNILSSEISPVEILSFRKPVDNINDPITELTIDLKGNFIATKTSCHAFIGTIFSNIRQYSSNLKVTEFIITELSIFCKGLVSSCQGVDVILL